MALHSHPSINQILMTEQKMDDLKQLMRDESNFEEIVLGAYRPICIIASLFSAHSMQQFFVLLRNSKYPGHVFLVVKALFVENCTRKISKFS